MSVVIAEDSSSGLELMTALYARCSVSAYQSARFNPPGKDCIGDCNRIVEVSEVFRVD